MMMTKMKSKVKMTMFCRTLYRGVTRNMMRKDAEVQWRKTSNILTFIYSLLPISGSELQDSAVLPWKAQVALPTQSASTPTDYVR